LNAQADKPVAINNIVPRYQTRRHETESRVIELKYISKVLEVNILVLLF